MDDEAGSKIFFFPERGAVGLLGIIMPEGGGGGYLSIFTFLCEF